MIGVLVPVSRIVLTCFDVRLDPDELEAVLLSGDDDDDDDELLCDLRQRRRQLIERLKIIDSSLKRTDFRPTT